MDNNNVLNALRGIVLITVVCLHDCCHFLVSQTDRQTDRCVHVTRTHRQADKRTCTHHTRTDRQTDRHMCTQHTPHIHERAHTNAHTHTETHAHVHTHTHTYIYSGHRPLISFSKKIYIFLNKTYYTGNNLEESVNSIINRLKCTLS